MKHILFVDDEQRILDGFKRMLRKYRTEWDVIFAGGGEEALAAFETRRFDVIVSDMLMPGMDGVQLLATVREKYPETIRIALSGHAATDMMLRAVGPTHQLLSKPCPPEVLKETVDRAMALHDTMGSSAVTRLIAGMDRIPSIPAVHQEVVAELRREDVDLRRLCGIVERDLGMTAFLLKLVNSAFFGSPQRRTNVERALYLIGLERFSSLVLAGHVFQEFDSVRIPWFSIQELWQHSLRTAQCAMAIAGAEGFSQEMQDDSFTAGLLHDVGKLVLAANLPQLFTQVAGEMRKSSDPTGAVERRVFGATHGEVGAYLLGLWGLPSTIVGAVAYHDEPRTADDATITLCGVVHIADAIAEGPSIEDPTAPECRVSMKYLDAVGLRHRWMDWREACGVATDEEALK